MVGIIRISEKQTEIICRLLKTTMPLQEIADEACCTINAIKRTAKKFNIPTGRPPREKQYGHSHSYSKRWLNEENRNSGIPDYMV